MLPGVGVTSRPRGVRFSRPDWIRKGSTTSSRVSVSSPRLTARFWMPTGPPPKCSMISCEVAAVQGFEAQRVDPQPSQPAVGGRPVDDARDPSTWAKSRTRRSRRLAARGVPRLRRAISRAPSGSMPMPRMPALRVTMIASSSGG